jgi:hypothetical protein
LLLLEFRSPSLATYLPFPCVTTFRFRHMPPLHEQKWSCSRLPERQLRQRVIQGRMSDATATLWLQAARTDCSLRMLTAAACSTRKIHTRPLVFACRFSSHTPESMHNHRMSQIDNEAARGNKATARVDLSRHRSTASASWRAWQHSRE